jgi:hypothetical protein
MAAPNHLNRRNILKGASAVGAGTLVAIGALEVGRAEAARMNSQGPVGSWVATVTIAEPGAPPPFQALRTYASGGGYIEDSSNSHNPLAPEGSGHGAWVSTGAPAEEANRFATGTRIFAVTFLIQRFDAKGNHIGSIKVRESATLNQIGDAYSGSGKFEILDLQGNRIASGLATIQATRITVEPFWRLLDARGHQA